MDDQEVKHVDVQESQEMLKCELTQEELLEFGESLANVQSDLKELESQLTGIKNEYKAKTTAKESEEERLGNLLRQKYEMRNVDCNVTYDFDEGTVTTTRLDSGELVGSRQMTDAELQRELKLFPENPGAGAGESATEDQITEAVKIICASKRAATTLLQRRMGLGYTKAAHIMDVLEDRGVVSAPKGNDPREILISADDYEAREELI